MNRIILDGKKMISREIAHTHMKEKLNAKEYYGNNLDALWDVLSTYDRNVKVEFINIESLIENLGDYGEFIVEVFKDAEKENKNIKFKIVYTNENEII